MGSDIINRLFDIIQFRINGLETICKLIIDARRKATVDKGIHDKSTKIELPTLYKVPPKRDYGRYFCRLARKEEPPHRGLMKSQAPFFMPKIRR